MPSKKENGIFIKQLFSSKIFLIFLTVILIFFCIQLGQKSYRKYQLQQEINSLKTEIQKLEGKNQEFSNLMNYLEKDSYLKQEARIKLNLKKPGEKMVVFPNSNSKETNDNFSDEMAVDSQTSQESKEVNYWQWWKYFFK